MTTRDEQDARGIAEAYALGLVGLARAYGLDVGAMLRSAEARASASAAAAREPVGDLDDPRRRRHLDAIEREERVPDGELHVGEGGHGPTLHEDAIWRDPNGIEHQLQYEIFGGVRGLGGTTSAWVTDDGLTVTSELILSEWTLVKAGGPAAEGAQGDAEPTIVDRLAAHGVDRSEAEAFVEDHGEARGAIWLRSLDTRARAASKGGA